MWVRSRGNQEQDAKGLLPVGSHRMHLFPPARGYEVFTREVGLRLKLQGFHGRLVTKAPTTQHVPKSQAPRRQAGVRHKPHCLYSLGLLSFLGMVGTFLKPKLLDANQGSTSQAGLSTNSSLKPAVFTLFYTPGHSGG